MTAQLSRPVTASWESLEPGTTSILSSITLPEKQEAKDEEKEDDSQDTKDGEMGREERNTAQMGIYSLLAACSDVQSVCSNKVSVPKLQLIIFSLFLSNGISPYRYF